MRKWVFMLFLFCSFSAMAQDMAAVFVAMPDEYAPQLEDAWRKDLVDLYRSKEEARLKNNMNGYAKLVKLTDDYLLLESTERTTIEMKLLPLVNNTFVICKVVTVKGPVPDSRISFFSPEWKQLDSADLFTPVAAAWFLRKDVDTTSVRYQEAISSLDMDMFQYRLSPDSLTLTQSYTTPLYVDRENRKLLKAYIKEEPRTFTWTKAYFK